MKKKICFSLFSLFICFSFVIACTGFYNPWDKTTFNPSQQDSKLPASDVNLLTDPGLEQGGSGWVENGPFDIVSGGTNYEGDWSVEATPDGTPTNTGIGQHNISVSQDTEYTIKLWIQGDADISVVVYDSDWNEIDVFDFTGTASWEEKVMTFNSGSHSTIHIQIEDRGTTAGTVWIDNFYLGIDSTSITPVPTETPSPVPTETPSPVPTETPSPVPTETPSPVPTETPAPGSIITNMVVNDSATSGDWSTQVNVQEGDTLFGDRSYTIDTLPAQYAGCDWIQTVGDAKNYTDSVLVTFDVTADVEVLILHDTDIDPKPAWLADNWTDTGDLMIDSVTSNYNIYTRAYSAGSSVSLGPNGQSSGVIGYTIFVKLQ